MTEIYEIFLPNLPPAELIPDNFFSVFTHVFVDRKFSSSSTRDNFLSTKTFVTLKKIRLHLHAEVACYLKN
ncbi:hypothetical protein NQ317_013638 [Molorchus minor]|uniref:Uncharacterized protein n=1 Tax=Molorchus minor TaxID=1323400 RepID=A0ABQ9JVW2_9CUCU|nr:hypothetical protein NQ317_013638 [Molorchus minor]